MPAGAAPTGVTIVTTSRCNQRCSYCFLRGQPAASPPWPAVRSSLDALLASPARHVKVNFTGGEPLLARPLMSRTVNYVNAHRRPDQSVRYKVLTNGLLLDASTVAWLRRHAFDVRISLDGGRGVQDRRSAGSFDAVDDVVRRLRRDAPSYFAAHVGVAMTVTPATVQSLAGSVSYLLKAGVGAIRIGAAMDVPDGRRDPFPEMDRQFAEVFDATLAHYRRTAVVAVTAFRKIFPFPLGRQVSPWVCGAPVGRHLAVDVDGDVSTCLLATKTYVNGRRLPPALLAAATALRAGEADEHLADRVRWVGLAAARAHVFASDVARHSSRGSCTTCDFADECAVCPLTMAGVLGPSRSLRVPAFQCAFNRVVAKYRARFPVQAPARGDSLFMHP